MTLPPESTDTVPAWAVSFGVTDVDEVCDRARRLGATGLQTPMIRGPGGDRIAVVTDPAGAVVGLVESDAGASMAWGGTGAVAADDAPGHELRRADRPLGRGVRRPPDVRLTDVPAPAGHRDPASGDAARMRMRRCSGVEATSLRGGSPRCFPPVPVHRHPRCALMDQAAGPQRRRVLGTEPSTSASARGGSEGPGQRGPSSRGPLRRPAGSLRSAGCRERGTGEDERTAAAR